jgi:SAM-dependent methyltransferase
VLRSTLIPADPRTLIGADCLQVMGQSEDVDMASSRSTDLWLERVFGATSAEELAKGYDRWSQTYDEDMLAVGYLNPAVAAGLLGRYGNDLNGGVLDAGCGTGLFGEIIAMLSYQRLVGIDMSEGMLAKARQRQIYADLRQRMLGEPLDFEDRCFAAVVSIGVFTTGHAPAHALDELVRVTRAGGHLIFTVSSAAWEAHGYQHKADALADAGLWRLVEVTRPYRPMPLSIAEGQFTTRCHVFERL